MFDERPPLEIFFARGEGGWARQFVQSLNGQPEKLPGAYDSLSGRSQVLREARLLGKTVATRKWRGSYWAFLIAEESGL